MTDTVPSYIAKLGRADEHLQTANALVDGWAKRDPCSLIADSDVKTREYRLRIRVFEPPPAVDLNIPISECIHNLRTALDHIGYRLAVHVGGDPPPNAAATGFPICSGPKHFANSLPNKIGKPKKIPPAMRTALENAQPYNGGQGANLPILQDLHDCDKHRFPPLLAAVGSVQRLNIGTFTGSSFQGPYMGPVEDGAIVLRFTPAPNTDVNMDIHVLFVVAFGPGYPGNGANVLAFLSGTLTYVRDTLLPSLAPFL